MQCHLVASQALICAQARLATNTGKHGVLFDAEGCCMFSAGLAAARLFTVVCQVLQAAELTTECG